ETGPSFSASALGSAARQRAAADGRTAVVTQITRIRVACGIINRLQLSKLCFKMNKFLPQNERILL
ncbi:MAG: hypothetical protein ACKPH7_32090, partial [Planktothrix sp.]|uniref:hypothetical protein n=1 Tax=Planktothrix sp. TaxID=3088171 RepID=UPI0038D515EA